MRAGLVAALSLFFASAAYAQLAPLPEPTLDRITPAEGAGDADMLSTKKPTPKTEQSAAPAAPAASNEAAAPLPWAKPAAPAAAKPAPAFGKATGMSKDELKKLNPFGKAAPAAPVLPEGPHTTVATPVVNVDAVEVSEPAPATPVAPEADPANQSAAEPTELTAPIFGEGDDSGRPRKIVLRVLNKVTAQSNLYKIPPHETVTFGRLEITAVMCRNSLPTSQRDSAALLDMYEQVSDSNEKKPVFRGWMYASSPSIAALEHPVYDVTLVDCDIAEPETPKPAPAAKPTAKPPVKKKK